MSELRQHYLDWPYEISIETYAKCNAACTFCPYPTLERQGVKMPDEMIDRIIDELKDHPHQFVIAPFKVNEPFLDKRLIPICRRINAELPNAHLRLFTNGSALTRANLEDVAALRQVVHLWISLNESDAAKYEETMSLPFNRTAANLDVLHSMVEFAEFGHEVVVSRVAADEGNREFVEYVSKRWPLFKAFLVKRDSWLGHIDGNDMPIPEAPCGRWYELNISATGVVALCCMDGKVEFPVGDLNTQSLFEVYNSKAYRQRRVERLNRQKVHPCATCNYGWLLGLLTFGLGVVSAFPSITQLS